MISKNRIKLIKSLDKKKSRQECGMFVAEGEKIVSDLLKSGFNPVEIYCTELLSYELNLSFKGMPVEPITYNELEKISFLKSPSSVIALFKIPNYKIDWVELQNELTVVLDTIQDPGNLGTIVRISNWFGIKNIICSPECVDLYNPKTIQSTMASLSSVKVHYTSLSEFLNQAKQYNIPVYGTFMSGENIFTTSLSESGLILLGNEGKGLSQEVANFVTKKLTIPSYPGKVSAESLNVATATAIICAEFRRRVIYTD